MQRTFTAVIHQEDKWYVAECPEVGTAGQGETLDEAIENLKEATELYLEETGMLSYKRSVVTTFEASTERPPRTDSCLKMLISLGLPAHS